MCVVCQPLIIISAHMFSGGEVNLQIHDYYVIYLTRLRKDLLYHLLLQLLCQMAFVFQKSAV